MPRTVLIVDDDPHIREILQFALDKAGFATDIAENGTEALHRVAAREPDLIVLDIAMPELDGLEVCRRVRKTSEVPILFLSSRDEEVDRIVGLELGGDDYLTKPFSPRELVARVKAILKRSMAVPASDAGEVRLLQKGQLRADLDGYKVYWKGRHVALTATEFQLLTAMMRHPEKVYQRDELMDQAYDGIIVSDRTIDSHIRRIRQKFTEAGAADIVETMHGIGYQLGSCL